MEIKPFDKKIWLASPYMHGEEEEYVRDAFRKNWITTAGENINELEKGVCGFSGAEYAVALSSGTSAIHMALIEAKVIKGDIVFCSDMTFAASANPIVYQGAVPVFIDSEEDTWNMDPQALREAFEKYPDAKAVICVNLYGIPAKLDDIKEICGEYGAVLIEDAAESLGAIYKGKQTGTWGDLGAVSFNGNKIITGSTGGMILTDNMESAEHIRKLSTQAREPVPWYEHEEAGYNYRMSNIVAGIVRGQLLHINDHIEGKKAIFERYKEGFKELPVIMHGGGNYWLSCMTLNGTDIVPNDIIERLASYNAEARNVWKPMSMQPVFRTYDCISHNVCSRLFETGICLPSDLNMTEEEQMKVINIVKSCFTKRR